MPLPQLHLLAGHAEARGLMERRGAGRVSFEHVSRDGNRHADALANASMDDGQHWEAVRRPELEALQESLGRGR